MTNATLSLNVAINATGARLRHSGQAQADYWNAYEFEMFKSWRKFVGPLNEMGEISRAYFMREYREQRERGAYPVEAAKIACQHYRMGFAG